jgi:hypothetical protein
MTKEILSWLIATDVLSLSWRLALWAVLGALIGIVIGLASFLFIRAKGGYRLDIRGAKWLRALVCTLNILGCAAACTYIGFFEGAWHGVKQTVNTHPLVAELRGEFGQMEAMLFAGVHHACVTVQLNPQIKPEEAKDQIQEGVKKFMAAQEEINAAELQQEMRTVGKAAISQVVDVVTALLSEAMPSLKEQTQGAILHRGLDLLGRVLVHDPSAKQLHNLGLDEYLDSILSGLPVEAARSGNTTTLSYQELSDYLGREGLVPWVLKAVHRFVWVHQLIALAAMGLLVSLFPLSFWIARKQIERRRIRREIAQPI